MAFASLLRSAASRGSVCPLQLASSSARLSSGPVTVMRGSSLLSTLNRSQVKHQTFLTKLGDVLPLKSTRVQPFSMSPKSYSAAAHNHSKLWTVERAVSAGLLLLVPAALLSPNKLLDTLAAISLVMHSHWGIEATVVDYIRPILFGNTISKVAMLSVYGLSIITLAGLFQLIYSDIGFANTIRKIWSL